MQRIEIVQVRLFDVNDGNLVMDAFHQIARERPESRINLYRSGTVSNDWSIYFLGADPNGSESKSSEAVCLAENLRQLGFVNHTLWMRVPIKAEGGRG